METTIIIAKREGVYVSTVSSQSGEEYSNRPIGRNPEEAAAAATQLMIDHAINNPDGGELIALPEIYALVPKHLHKVKAARNEKV
jgi:hypothetical protein